MYATTNLKYLINRHTFNYLEWCIINDGYLKTITAED